ncbi:Uncharacterised protein [Shigella sonnei]|nr:Uncharacterised protein [Shigella sonnei]CST14990.1 Uncharacterised protein [Shigella sonnei]
MPPTVRQAFWRQNSQPFQHCGGIFSPVGFYHANHNIQPLRPQSLGFCQHRPGLPDACTGTEENFQLPPMRRGSLFQQTIGVGT